MGRRQVHAEALIFARLTSRPAFCLLLSVVLREIEEEDALWQKKSRRRKESASTEDPLKRDTVPGLSEAVRGGRNEANGDPGNGTQSSRRRTGPSHGFY